MSKIKVIGLGAMNMDYLCRVARILEDGEAIIKEFTLSPGGSAANTVYGLARLGVSAGFAGVVGDDEDGRRLVQNFQNVGVDITRIKVKPQAKTGVAICLSDTQSWRSLYVLPGANNLLTIDDLDVDYINQAQLFHISSFAEARQLGISVKLVRKLAPSVKVSFAPGALYAGLGLKSLAPMLERTHILFINHDELRQLTGQDIAPGAETCLKHGCQIVVVTLGKGMKLETGRGAVRRKVTAVAYIREGKKEYFVEPSDPNLMPVLETTGAGDAFVTGFLFGWLQEKALQECGILGDLVARFSMTRMGARQGLPTHQELVSSLPPALQS